MLPMLSPLLALSASAAVLNVPGDAPSITKAVEDAVNGDEIVVAAGTYFEEDVRIDDFVGLTIRGAGVTTVLSSNNKTGFHLDTSTGVVIEGFSFASSNKALDINKSQVELIDLTIDGLSTPHEGLVMKVHGPSDVVLRDSVISDNLNTGEEGAIHCKAGSTLEIVNTVLSGNEADLGGAIFADDCTLIVTDSSFSANFADTGGAGVYLLGATSSLTMLNVGFDGNIANDEGAAVYVEDASVDATDVTIADHDNTHAAVRLDGSAVWDGLRDIASGNTGTSSSAVFEVLGNSSLELRDGEFSNNNGVEGGVIHASTTRELVLEGMRFSGNSASLTGGGVFVENGPLTVDRGVFINNDSALGGAVAVLAAEEALIRRSHFCENASTGAGGAVQGSGVAATAFDVVNSNFVGNTAAGDGGALHLDVLGEPSIRNSTFVANDAAEGGAIYVGGDEAFTLYNSIIAWTSGGNGVSVENYQGPIYSFTYDDWWDNTAAHLGSGVSVLPLNTPPHVLQDPGFMAFSDDGNCGNDDLRLGYGSPLVDAGDPLADDPDGTPSDIGSCGGPEAQASCKRDEDGDSFDQTLDCDDADVDANPLAPEVCDGVDNNCDGDVDEGCEADTDTDADTDSDTDADTDADSDVDTNWPETSSREPDLVLDTGTEPAGAGCACSSGAPVGALWALPVILLVGRRRIRGR